MSQVENAIKATLTAVEAAATELADQSAKANTGGSTNPRLVAATAVFQFAPALLDALRGMKQSHADPDRVPESD